MDSSFPSGTFRAQDGIEYRLGLRSSCSMFVRAIVNAEYPPPYVYENQIVPSRRKAEEISEVLRRYPPK